MLDSFILKFDPGCSIPFSWYQALALLKDLLWAPRSLNALSEKGFFSSKLLSPRLSPLDKFEKALSVSVLKESIDPSSLLNTESISFSTLGKSAKFFNVADDLTRFLASSLDRLITKSLFLRPSVIFLSKLLRIVDLPSLSKAIVSAITWL